MIAILLCVNFLNQQGPERSLGNIPAPRRFGAGSARNRRAVCAGSLSAGEEKVDVVPHTSSPAFLYVKFSLVKVRDLGPTLPVKEMVGAGTLEVRMVKS